MMFESTFNNISWRAVLLVEETRVPRENHRLYQMMLYRVHLTMNWIPTNKVSGDKLRLHR